MQGQVGWQWLGDLSDRPDADSLRKAAAAWAPHRSAAALLIWRFYLSDTARRRAERAPSAKLKRATDPPRRTS